MMYLKRIFDLILVLIIAIILIIPMCIIAFMVCVTSNGPILYWSDRVGKNNLIFKMPKFRSMKHDTKVVATHLLEDPNSALTPIGSFLRKSSIDELPQLWNILLGEMTFVGPRPALFNQADLVALRTENHVHKLVPGLTGWAQINGRDNLSVSQKVALDIEYLKKHSFLLDLEILWVTVLRVIKRVGITH